MVVVRVVVVIGARDRHRLDVGVSHAQKGCIDLSIRLLYSGVIVTWKTIVSSGISGITFFALVFAFNDGDCNIRSRKERVFGVCSLD